MSKHRTSGSSRLRNIGRAGAVVAGGALAISGIMTGTASAAEGYGDTGHDSTASSGSTAPKSTAFTPTTPVDGFVYHWGKYHYGEENFAGDEVKRITTDPGKYVDIHLDMVKMMAGLTPEGDMGTGPSGY
ncbi:hypothetical protein ACQEVB_38450 [Pseudonocardia sp. CA-107938]|uniref:hypothetical protein n=1 Tax=Pseudonocardia sp. CA-107938 TaxID=3240021 RepID=UPI003D935772